MAVDRSDIAAINSDLIAARHAYYVQADPIISDPEYDRLERALKEMVKGDPGARVLATVLDSIGSDLTTDGGRITHISRMLSIENCYTIDELREWLEDVVLRYPEVGIAIEPKVDGNSCSLSYLERKLIKAVTRGDGEAGEDITKLMAASGSIPLVLPEGLFPDSLVEVRGEVWISRSRLDSLNEELAKLGKKVYVSQRNLASGTMKLKDLDEVKRRGLKFQPWDCFGLSDELLVNKQYSSRWRSHSLDYLYRCGTFAQPKLRTLMGKDLLAALSLHLEEMRKEREVVWHGPGLGMLTDGLVFKVDTPSVREALGDDGHFPSWARAYKFQDSKGETVLLRLEWYVSRNGKLTPVGILEPIVLNGASISRVNLNNVTFIGELGIDSLPCRVEVCRSGDVIPIITKVIKE